MFTFTESATAEKAEWNEVESQAVSQHNQRQNIIDAHQTLIDVHEDNRDEFKDIVDFLNLEKEIEEEEKKKKEDEGKGKNDDQ